MKALGRNWKLLAPAAAVQAVFLVLRLTGVIRWPWWLVLAPLWAPVVVCLVFLGVDLLAVSQWGKTRG